MNAVMNRFNIPFSHVASGFAALTVTIAMALPASAVPAEVVADQVNVRAGATTESVVQGRLRLGDRVEVLDGMRGQDGYIWYSVKVDELTDGWVREGLVSIQAIGGEFVRSSAVLKGSMPGDGVNVRSGPSQWYNVRFSGMHGDRATVTNMARGKDGYVWYQVAIPNTNGGWVRSELVQVLNPMPE